MSFSDLPTGWKVVITNIIILVVYHNIFHK